MGDGQGSGVGNLCAGALVALFQIGEWRYCLRASAVEISKDYCVPDARQHARPNIQARRNGRVSTTQSLTCRQLRRKSDRHDLSVALGTRGLFIRRDACAQRNRFRISPPPRIDPCVYYFASLRALMCWRTNRPVRPMYCLKAYNSSNTCTEIRTPRRCVVSTNRRSNQLLKHTNTSSYSERARNKPDHRCSFVFACILQLIGKETQPR